MSAEHNNPNGLELEPLALECFAELTAAEIKLVRAASKGELAVCGLSDDPIHPSNDPSHAVQWGNEREIRAGLIEWLCRDLRALSLVHSKGIQILGAKVLDAVDLSFITIDFPLVLAYCRLLDKLNLQGARTRTISLPRCRVHSILGDGAVLMGAAFLRHGFHAEYGVVLSGASIEGQLDCSGSSFENINSSPAFIADGAVVSGSVFLKNGFRASGEVRFHHARIGADLDCTAGTFKSNAQPGAMQFSAALDCEGLVVGGSVFLRNGFRAIGLVLLHGAQVGFNLDCAAGRFENLAQVGNEVSLNGDACVVKGTVLLSAGFKAEGRVSFTGSQIDGDLNCANAKFTEGLVAERAIVRSALFWRDIAPLTTLSLNLLNTSAGSLSDDTGSWPARGNLQLHGFVYERISAFSPRDAKSRLDWLARLKSFTPQPYRQLAKNLKDEGDYGGAQKVMYTMATLRNQESTNKLARVWNFILRYTVGYGYYPEWALFWLIGIVLLGATFFTEGYYAGSMVPTDKEAYVSFRNAHRLPEYYERFHASAYSLENSFPLVKLGQADHWQPDPSPRDPPLKRSCLNYLVRFVTSTEVLQLVRWIQILLGWFLATMGVAAVTGVVRKD